MCNIPLLVSIPARFDAGWDRHVCTKVQPMVDLLSIAAQLCTLHKTGARMLRMLAAYDAIR